MKGHHNDPEGDVVRPSGISNGFGASGARGGPNRGAINWILRLATVLPERLAITTVSALAVT